MRTTIRAVVRAASRLTWAIEESKLREIFEILERRAEGEGPPAGFKARTAQGPSSVAAGKGRVVVLPLQGVISQRMNMVSDASGGTSCELFGKQFEAAVGDPAVTTIVLDVDSPGGAVNGVPELAAKMFALRGKKRVIAHANTMMASAAYWIASAADEIVASPSAEVGSVGVFTVHVDESRANDAAGLDVTVVKAGDFKAEDLPFEPLSESGKAALQSDVDDLYAMFTGDVAKHRGVSVGRVQADYGKGRVLNARRALGAGMVDRIQSFEDLLKSLGVGGQARRSSPVPGVAAAEHEPTRRVAMARGTDALTRALVALNATPVRASVRGSTVNHSDDTSKGPYNEPARDPLQDPPSTTPKQADEADADDSDYEPGPCEVCNNAMDSNGVCSNCGWVDPDGPSADAPRDEDGGSPNDLPTGDPTDSPLRIPGDNAPDGAIAPRRRRVVRGDTLDPAPLAVTAKGASMPEGNGTAPANGAATVDRFPQLAALAKDHGRGLDDVSKWMAAGASVDSVREEILATYRNGARPVSAGPVISGVNDLMDGHEFETFGRQLVAIINQSSPRGTRNQEDYSRLAHVQARARQFFAGTPAGMSEGISTDGGFFIQPELLPGVIDPMYKEDALLSRVTRIPIAANTNGVRYPVVDEISRVTGSRWGALQMYWLSEADTATASKPKLRLMELNLKKLIGIAYLTDELIGNAPAAESLLTRAFVSETQFMVTAAIFSGTGGGQPQGILNSGATVSQAIEGTQTIANSANFLGLNTTKMLSRIPSSLWGDMIWLYQQELLPYLMNATIGASGTAVPIFVPLGGFVNRPFDMIMGRPAFPSEFCAAVGTPGDIIALVPSQYHLGEQGGINTAWSIHVQFLTDQTALRITQRLDGAPLWRSAVTPYLGANSRSPFITLAVRS